MILLHPDTLRWLRFKMTEKLPSGILGDDEKFLAAFYGDRVTASPQVSRWHQKWRFPDHPHVEYEASDEAWCRYFGIGHDVDDIGNPAIFRVAYDDMNFLAMFQRPSTFSAPDKEGNMFRIRSSMGPIYKGKKI